jgi:D-cysteine desulfhydrase
MIQPPRLSLARLPTPLVPLERLSDALGGPRIWLKRDDLTDTVASGNKLRKLEFTIAQALEEQATVLITCGGMQSNHCRATAVIASQLGLKSHLVLRGREVDPPDGNLLLDRLVGAEIDFATAEEFADLDGRFARIASDYESRGERPFCIPVGASDEIGLWGYIEAAAELASDFDAQGIDPDWVVSAAGSGGTLGGLILGKQIHSLDTEMVAFNVCDDEGYFLEKIRSDFNLWRDRYEAGQIDVSSLPINVIDGYVGPGYGRADAGVFDTIRQVARTEGVILDPVYTGKAFTAMLQEMKPGGRLSGAEDIVFVHTGGIFGLFPQRANLWLNSPP